VYGFEAAIRGMRNPMNSWEKSDSFIRTCSKGDLDRLCDKNCQDPYCSGPNISGIGKNDLDLMIRLRNAGTDHRKFMRMITVTLDITAPLYWWKEFDTYKVGTVANSCSTMHKIHAKEFDVNDFSHEHVEELTGDDYNMSYDFLLRTVDILNYYRKKFLETNNKKYWWQMIQLLPSSYNQRRTVMLNYEVLTNIYHARKNHKLDEWHTFCDWIEELPYSELITNNGNEEL
jgi:hypothetical protein